MLITKVKRIDSNIKIKRISEAECNIPFTHIPSLANIIDSMEEVIAVSVKF